MTATAPQPPISAAERQRRQKAVDMARASVRLEGFILDEATEALNARYVAGELSRPELNPAVLELASINS